MRLISRQLARLAAHLACMMPTLRRLGHGAWAWQVSMAHPARSDWTTAMHKACGRRILL